MLTTAILFLSLYAANSTNGVVKHAIRSLMIVDTVIWLRPRELVHQDVILACTVLVVTWAIFPKEITSLYVSIVEFVKTQLSTSGIPLDAFSLPSSALTPDKPHLRRSSLSSFLRERLDRVCSAMDRNNPSSVLTSDEFRGFSDSELSLDPECSWPDLSAE